MEMEKLKGKNKHENDSINKIKNKTQILSNGLETRKKPKTTPEQKQVSTTDS